MLDLEEILWTNRDQTAVFNFEIGISAWIIEFGNGVCNFQSLL